MTLLLSKFLLGTGGAEAQSVKYLLLLLLKCSLLLLVLLKDPHS